MSFKPQVKTGRDPEFYGNSLAFATEAEALASAQALMDRWFLVIECRAIESTDPVTHTLIDGVLSYVAKEVA